MSKIKELREALAVLASHGLELTPMSRRDLEYSLRCLENEERANNDGFMEGDRVESLLSPGEFGKVLYSEGCCDSDKCGPAVEGWRSPRGIELRIEWEPCARIPEGSTWTNCSRTIKRAPPV